MGCDVVTQLEKAIEQIQALGPVEPREAAVARKLV
jgi:hypothetical protein